MVLHQLDSDEGSLSAITSQPIAMVEMNAEAREWLHPGNQRRPTWARLRV